MLLLTLWGSANAQLAPLYPLTTSSGTYSSISGTGTVATAVVADNGGLNIALSPGFTVNGTTYPNARMNSNGYVILYTGALGSYTSNPSESAVLSTASGAAAAGVAFAPFNADMIQSNVATTNAYYQTIGNEHIFEWQNFSRYNLTASNRTDVLNFQLRLNHSTGEIKFVYGTMTAGIPTQTPQVGWKTNANTASNWSTDINNLMLDVTGSPNTCDWSNAVTGNINTSTMYLNSANPNVKPASGLTFTFTPQSAPSPVRTFSAVSAITDNGATITWTAPAGATQYNVQYRAVGSCAWTNWANNPVSANTVTLTGLNANTAYQVRVQSSNGANTAIYSHIPNQAGTGNGYVAAGTFTTAQLICSGTPEAGTISGVLVRPTCGGSAPSPSTAAATGYTTDYSGIAFQWETSTDGVIWSNAPGASATTPTYTLPNHTGGQTEYYRLKVTCTNSGLFDVSDVNVQVTDQIVPVTQASNITTSALGLTTATITWTNGSGGRRYVVINNTNSFTDPVGTGNVTVVGTTYSGSGEQIVYDGTGSSVSVSGLATGTTYYVRVYEYNRCTGSPNVNYYNVSTATNNPGNFTTLMAAVNDNCAGALPFPTILNDANCSTVIANTAAATGSADATCSGTEDDDLWYTFNCPVGVTSLLYTNTTVSGNADRMLQIYSGTCTGLTSIGCYDPESGTITGLTGGQTYYLRVYTYGSGVVTEVSICLRTAPLPPANDECANAITVPVTNGLATQPVAGTMNGATISSGTFNSGCSTFSSDHDVWYTLTVPASGNVDIETFVTGGTANADNDYSLQVYSGSCGALTYVGCSEDASLYGAPTNYMPAISLTGQTPGSPLYLRIRKTTSSRNTFTIAAYDPTVLLPAANTDCSAATVNISLASGNGYRWVPLLDSGGGLIAELFAYGNNLGTVTSSVNQNVGAVRQDGNGTYYLDRDFAISVQNQPTSAVDMYVYFPESELLALQAVDGSVADASDLSATKTSNACGQNPSSGGTLLTNYDNFVRTDNTQAVAFSLTSFSTFYLHGGALPLPVNLVSFDARSLDGRSVLVSWNVTDERGLKEYVVERSTDGRNFSVVGTVSASLRSTYTFVDEQPEQKINYYRLKMIDTDGSTGISPVRQVAFSAGKALALYPNPTSGNIFISGMESANEPAQVTVFNELGQEVWSGKVQGEQLATQGIDMGSFAAGAYIVKIVANDVNTSLRFIRQ